MKKKENFNYFNEFIKLTDCIVKSANSLKEIIEKYNYSELDEDIKEVHAVENEADMIVHLTHMNLVKDFLPPIEREDVYLIANKLDDIEDGIDEVLINFKILNIAEIKNEVLELINILGLCCNAVREAFLDLKNFKKTELINEKVIEVNKLEEQGDRAFEKLMTNLYRDEKDVMTLIRWTKIYNCLENTIDSCEEIADVIQNVAMKNS